MKQEQFLSVVSPDEAQRRFREAVDFSPLEAEACPVGRALGRVLAGEIRAEHDVPAFTRSNFDGFAVRAQDTYGATEEEPVRLQPNDEQLATGVLPALEVTPGTATAIATGAVLPRGADAVIKVRLETASTANGKLRISPRSLTGFVMIS